MQRDGSSTYMQRVIIDYCRDLKRFHFFDDFALA